MSDAAPTGARRKPGVALARRSPEDVGLRTMTVGPSPAELVAMIVELGAMVQRRVVDGAKRDPSQHDGAIFYEPTPDGLVLWRRPDAPMHDEPQPLGLFPDMVEVRLEAVPHGSRVELRWRSHPFTRFALRLTVITLAACWVLLLLVVGTGLMAQPWIAVIPAMLVTVRVAVRDRRRLRKRRALQPLLQRIHAALARLELGPAEIEGSAFRAPAGTGPLTSRRR